MALASALAILAGMRNLATVLSDTARTARFPPADEAVLVATASGLWKSRRILEDALDSAEIRRRAAPVVSVPVQASTAAQRQTAPPAVDAIGMAEASEISGWPRRGHSVGC
jgi:hypothetical protein